MLIEFGGFTSIVATSSLHSGYLQTNATIKSLNQNWTKINHVDNVWLHMICGTMLNNVLRVVEYK